MSRGGYKLVVKKLESSRSITTVKRVNSKRREEKTGKCMHEDDIPALSQLLISTCLTSDSCSREIVLEDGSTNENIMHPICTAE